MMEVTQEMLMDFAEEAIVLEGHRLVRFQAKEQGQSDVDVPSDEAALTPGSP